METLPPAPLSQTGPRPPSTGPACTPTQPPPSFLSSQVQCLTLCPGSSSLLLPGFPGACAPAPGPGSPGLPDPSLAPTSLPAPALDTLCIPLCILWWWGVTALHAGSSPGVQGSQVCPPHVFLLGAPPGTEGRTTVLEGQVCRSSGTLLGSLCPAASRGPWESFLRSPPLTTGPQASGLPCNQLRRAALGCPLLARWVYCV